MTNNKTLNRGGQTYEAPSVNLLDIQVEGVLCASFGEANKAGKTLDENEDFTWTF